MRRKLEQQGEGQSGSSFEQQCAAIGKVFRQKHKPPSKRQLEQHFAEWLNQRLKNAGVPDK